VGLGPGIPCVFILSFDGGVASAPRNTSDIAAPPLMARICIGSWGEGAKWTNHLVVGGGRSPSLNMPFCFFVAVTFSRRGVGAPSSRLVIVMMSKLCLCYYCASCRVHSSGSHRTRNSSTKAVILLCSKRRGGHYSNTTLMCALSPLATPKRFSSNLYFPFEVGFPLVKLSLSGRWKWRIILGGVPIATLIGVRACLRVALRMQ
jgi:hypothetical protein